MQPRESGRAIGFVWVTAISPLSAVESPTAGSAIPGTVGGAHPTVSPFMTIL